MAESFEKQPSINLAGDIKKVKESLDIVIPVFQRVSTFYQISAIMKISGVLFPALQVVGALFALAGTFLPDPKHAEIINRLGELSNKIDLVRGDIKHLKDEIKWDITEQTYVYAVHQIELGMQYCLDIGKANKNVTWMARKEDLRFLCANEKCYIDLNFILDGMIGEGTMKTSIFDKLYDKTGGDRSGISALGIQLMQVAFGGMMVMSTYETMKHGDVAAEDRLRHLHERLQEAAIKIQSILDRCQNETIFRENMLNDLNSKLDEGGSNEYLATKISGLMSVKYDWLETVVIVYNDLVGFDKHCFNGYRVHSLHRNNKCGIVFYQDKNKKPKVSDRYTEASSIVDGIKSYKLGFDAMECYDIIAANLNATGIEWTGLAVIGKPDTAELFYVNSFSTKIIYYEEFHVYTGILSLFDDDLLLKRIVLAKIFLLLA